MKVHSYYTAGGKDLIIDYINGLSKDEKADGYSVLEEMEKVSRRIFICFTLVKNRKIKLKN